MKTFTSFHELDALGEGLSKDYISRTHRWNARCFDIEGFITDYLGLPACSREQNFAKSMTKTILRRC